MSYQVLARKWRPRSFREMVGQEHVLRALGNALAHGRLHHAYLFTGTRGVGKTTVARILAKCLNCEQGVVAEPCGACPPCRAIDAGRFVDLIEVDAASRTRVEDTRELLDNVQYAPTEGRFKVYLIDEVHMLSAHSFNALLKTLEEPPPHVKFLLATTDPQRLPVTVLSRCLQLHLKRLPPERIAAHLARVLEAEGIPGEPAALARLARAADGSMRDALSLLDQAIAYGGGAVRADEVQAMLGVLEATQVAGLVEALAEGEPARLLEQVRALVERSPDYDAVLAELAAFLHRVAVAQLLPEAPDEALGGEEEAGRARELARRVAPEDVQLWYQIALAGRRDLPLAPDPALGLEMTLLRMLAFRPAEAEGRPAPLSRIPATGEAAGGKAGRETAEGAHAPRVQQTGGAPQASSQAESWVALVEALPQGPVRQLASHCVLEGREGNRFRLALDPAYAGLRTPRLEQRLKEALERAIGGPVRLSLRLLEGPAGEGGAPTPAARREAEARARREAAAAALDGDPEVQALRELLGARVVPGSVAPLEGGGGAEG